MTDIDLSAPRSNVKVTRGDAWSIALIFPRNPGAIASQLRATYDSTTATTLDVSAAVEGDYTVNGATVHGWRFSVGQVAANTPGVFDVQITETGGLPRTYFSATLILGPDVTRP